MYKDLEVKHANTRLELDNSKKEMEKLKAMMEKGGKDGLFNELKEARIEKLEKQLKNKEQEAVNNDKTDGLFDELKMARIGNLEKQLKKFEGQNHELQALTKQL